MALGRQYRIRQDYEAAHQQYELAMKAGSAQVAASAKAATEDLAAYLAQLPIQVEDLAKKLERDGFLSDIWRERTGVGGTQGVSGGVLQLRSLGGEREVLVGRESIRPVRNFGFSAGVRFKVSASLMERPGTCRAGIGVSDGAGKDFRFSFDGAGYRAFSGAEGMGAGGKLAEAFGDEAEAWHTLGFAYRFDTAQISVLLDGQPLRRYSTDLGDCRLRVFLEAEESAAAEAYFSDISWRL